jgi:hypothetical protein
MESGSNQMAEQKELNYRETSSIATSNNEEEKDAVEFKKVYEILKSLDQYKLAFGSKSIFNFTISGINYKKTTDLTYR